MTLSDALMYVKKQRYFINPNDGFRRQLQAFQRELNSKREVVETGVITGPAPES